MPTTTGTSAGSPSAIVDTGDLGPEWELAEIAIGELPLLVAVADTSSARSQGLRAVDDLGEVDGMIFTWEEEVAAPFTMRGTSIPLDIAFFSVDGRLVDKLRMVPCAAEPCPSYRAGAPFAFAVETPAGRLDRITPDAMLTFRSG